MRRAAEDPSDENLHEWRKRAKYYRYHLRLLRGLWPPVVSSMRDAAKLLSDRLGDDHDLAVLHRVIVDEKHRFGSGDRELWLGLIGQRRKELQALVASDLDTPPGREAEAPRGADASLLGSGKPASSSTSSRACCPKARRP